VPAGATGPELRSADRQTLASLRYGLHTTISAGGKTFTKKRVPRSPWPHIAQIIGYTPPRSGKFLAKISRVAFRLRELRDETGSPVLYTSGKHYNHVPGANIAFPDHRSLTFPVRGTSLANAIMTAVDRDGHTVARYRSRIYSAEFRGDTVEIIVHPVQQLTEELLLAIALSAPWLRSYFEDSHG
jgi:hypothetical protein